jgi:hypothetical protein
MSSNTFLDRLGAQVICRLGHLSGRGGEDALNESTTVSKFNCFFFVLLRNFNSLLHLGIFSFDGRH